MDLIDKLEEGRKKYQASEKGKTTRDKYQKSEKGIQTRNKYLASDKGLETQLRYRLSEKGRKALQRRKDLEKLFRKASNWILENPGKTLEDYLKEVSSESSN